MSAARRPLPGLAASTAALLLCLALLAPGAAPAAAGSATPPAPPQAAVVDDDPEPPSEPTPAPAPHPQLPELEQSGFDPGRYGFQFFNGWRTTLAIRLPLVGRVDPRSFGFGRSSPPTTSPRPRRGGPTSATTAGRIADEASGG